MGSSRFHLRFRLLTAAAMVLALSACSDPPIDTRDPIAVWTPVPTEQVQVNVEGDPKTFDFGTVRLGDKATGYLQIENQGSAPGTVKYPANLEAPFSVNIPGAGLTVGVGEKKMIEVTFAPAEAGDYEWNGLLELVEDPDQKIAAKLVGVGEAPAFSCDTERLDFGKVVKGREKELSVTCTNNSDVSGILVVN